MIKRDPWHCYAVSKWNLSREDSLLLPVTLTFSHNLSLADLYLVMSCRHIVDRSTVQYFRLEHDAGIRFLYAAQQKTFRLFRSAGHNDLKRTFGYISFLSVYRSCTRNRWLRPGIRRRATLSCSTVSRCRERCVGGNCDLILSDDVRWVWCVFSVYRTALRFIWKGCGRWVPYVIDFNRV